MWGVGSPRKSRATEAPVSPPPRDCWSVYMFRATRRPYLECVVCTRNVGGGGGVVVASAQLHRLLCMYVIRTNQMHYIFINDLIQRYCLRHASNIQAFILRKTCTCSFMVFLSCIHISRILPSARLLIWMHERNTIKLHVQSS
jgi:hypothetical protein